MPFPEDPTSRRGWVLMSSEASSLAQSLDTWAEQRESGASLADLRTAFHARALAVHARFLAAALGRVERGTASPREGTELVAELTDLRTRAKQVLGGSRDSDPPLSPPRAPSTG
jgi:hypothetical protein